MKRSSFTMLEILLAASLLALITSTVFFWYRIEEKGTLRLGRVKEKVLEESNADFQLRELFSGVRADAEFYTKESGSLGSSLVVTFDHKIDKSPYLSGDVVGELYLDADQRLILMVWPHPKQNTREPIIERVILEDVKSLEFSFYNPRPSDLVVDPDKVGLVPKVGWQNLWERGYKKIPALVELKLERGSDEPLKFVYDLPQSSDTIRLVR